MVALCPAVPAAAPAAAAAARRAARPSAALPCAAAPSAAAAPAAALRASRASRALAARALAPPAVRAARRAAPQCPRATSAQQATPTPVVSIDNLSDPLATIVEVSFGDLLGELLDTVQSLKNLGLDISRADLVEGTGRNRFYITDAKTSEKVTLSERLEEIRATIINNMLTYHPESRESLAAGRKTSDKADKVLGTRPPTAIPTSIRIQPSASGSRSALELTTTDRPGLLVDIVRVLKDCSLNVVSASINTVGLAAKDTFYVTYRGKALNSSMEQLVINALQYYLTMAELEKDESY